MTRHVAVIGAGISGLSCARRLMEAGLTVVVYEKSRGLGGRCTTRRIDDQAFDHGAQYATAEGDSFREFLSCLEDYELATRWSAAEATRGDERNCYIAKPGMSGLATALGKGIDVRFKTRVTGMVHTAEGWALALDNGDAEGAFSAVVMAMPAPQVLELLPQSHGFRRDLERVDFVPCWTVMASFAEKLPAPDVIQNSGAIIWAARNSAKPGRPAGEAWVVQAHTDWSAIHLDDAPEQVETMLLADLAAHIGHPLPTPTHLSSHRWRYARVAETLSRDHLWDDHLGVGVCGDFCIAPRIEAAFTSGEALGRAMSRSLAEPS